MLIPFITAPIIVFIGRRELAWPLAFIASLSSFLVACLLLSKVIGGEIISYKIGGWAPPLGIEYRVDAANAFVLFLVTAIATLVLPYARQSITAEMPQRSQTLFYTLFLLCLTGLLGVTTTADAFNAVSYTHLRAHETREGSRMPSSA